MTEPRADFLVAAGWFDAAWYVERAPVPLGDADPLTHYLAHGAPAGLAPNPAVAALQEPVELGGGPPPDSGASAPLPAGDDPQLALEMRLVEQSGLFDPAFYVAQNPQLVPAGVPPLEHFCRVGWRHLLRPHAGFDVWWYWATYLDPGREALNPFVHYLLVGRAAGLLGRPASTRARSWTRLPHDRPVRRVCLFAGYDRDGLVDDHVVRYIRELGRFADVYYLADGYVEPEELARLDGLVAGAWSVRHGAYDFGSYATLARELVGWDVIGQYDELLLVNDSCYLLRPLDDVFARMDERACDWWGLQATKGLYLTRDRPTNAATEPVPLSEVRDHLLEAFEQDDLYDFHVGSYFLAYRGPVLADRRFRRLLETVHTQRGKLAIVQKYEIGLTHHLIGHGYAFDTYVDRLYPFHPLFTPWAFTLVDRGFPLLKKYFLYQNHYDVPGLVDWKERVLAAAPEAPVAEMEANLLRTSPHDRLTRSFAIVRGDDGATRVPRPAGPARLRRMDERTPTFDHWWAFPVADDLHTLPDASRAVLEEVRDDPSLHKIVLTRSREVRIDGDNLVVVPLDSPEGQHQLLRAGHIFVDEHPGPALRVRLAPGRHRVHVLRAGLVLDGAGRPAVPARPTREEVRPTLASIATSSSVDRLVALASHYPALYDDCWSTGLPALDLVVRDADRLPDDLREQRDRLSAEVDGRRLVLLATARGRSASGVGYPFAPDEVAWLADWSRRHDAVLGLREHPGDLERHYRRVLRTVTLDLSAHRQPSFAVLLGGADALVTDYAGDALQLLATGRPVVGFLHDLPALSTRLLVDPDHVFPDPVCRTFEQLADALDHVFDPPDEGRRHRYERSRGLFFDRADDQGAHRLVQRVRWRAMTGAGA